MTEPKKKLARNLEMMISAEFLKQMFDELVAAGFTEDQALKYMVLLVTQFKSNGKKDGKSKE